MDAVIWLEPDIPDSSGIRRDIAGAPLVIARQMLVIWSTVRNVRHLSAANLLAPEFRRVAVADPSASRSGKSAKQALMNAGIWGPLHGRLVFAGTSEKIVELVRSGAVDAGILEMSLVTKSGPGPKGSFAPLPLKQGLMPELRLGLTRQGSRKPSALDFASYMISPTAEMILRRFGYGAP